MTATLSVTEDLSLLHELDAAAKRRSEPKSARAKELAIEAKTVRERLPTAILQHYDLRISKGKRGAAKVRNGICGGCHLSLPCGQLADLRRTDVTLLVCCNCSIFLLPEDPQPEAIVAAPEKVETAPAVKKVAKTQAQDRSVEAEANA